MAALVRQGFQHLAGQAGDLHFAQAAPRQVQHKALHPRIVQRTHRPAADGGQAVAHALGIGGLGQPGRHAAGGIKFAHLGQHLFGGQKVLGNEVGQVAANAVFVLGNDRGVRNRQAQRVAEQRHHGKPVGNGTHHRRLGKGGHPGPDGVACELPLRQQLQRGGGQQQTQRQRLHAAEVVGLLLLGGAQRHACTVGA